MEVIQLEKSAGEIVEQTPWGLFVAWKDEENMRYNTTLICRGSIFSHDVIVTYSVDDLAPLELEYDYSLWLLGRWAVWSYAWGECTLERKQESRQNEWRRVLIFAIQAGIGNMELANMLSGLWGVSP
jgi:hypothetical protein